MTTYTTIEVDARQYEDADDCLTAAAEEYAADHGLESWQVTAGWAGGDDGDRDRIELRVPPEECEIDPDLTYGAES